MIQSAGSVRLPNRFLCHSARPLLTSMWLELLRSFWRSRSNSNFHSLGSTLGYFTFGSRRPRSSDSSDHDCHGWDKKFASKNVRPEKSLILLEKCLVFMFLDVKYFMMLLCDQNTCIRVLKSVGAVAERLVVFGQNLPSLKKWSEIFRTTLKIEIRS